MKHIDTRSFESFFHVVAGTSRSQAAIMILGPGKSTGGADNRHENADQWLYVTSGRGRATVEGESVELSPGSLLLIEAGEAHEIENAGEERLRTVSVYAPPEY
ncbi:MAG TPA: cupin domain-containing protein [Gemmatimonadota bacterium]|nr:cupin domain-containing protein [Gemmatimonadota bacterium]